MIQLSQIQQCWVAEGVKAHCALFSVWNNKTRLAEFWIGSCSLLPNNADPNRGGMKENWPHRRLDKHLWSCGAIMKGRIRFVFVWWTQAVALRGAQKCRCSPRPVQSCHNHYNTCTKLTELIIFTHCCCRETKPHVMWHKGVFRRILQFAQPQRG